MENRIKRLPVSFEITNNKPESEDIIIYKDEDEFSISCNHELCDSLDFTLKSSTSHLVSEPIKTNHIYSKMKLSVGLQKFGAMVNPPFVLLDILTIHIRRNQGIVLESPIIGTVTIL